MGGERVALGYVAKPERGAGLGLLILRDDHDLCDRFGEEGFTALATGDLEDGIAWLLASDAVRGDGVGVLAFDADVAAIDRPDVQAIVVVDPNAVEPENRSVQVHESLDDHAWTRTLEFLRAKLG